MGFLPLFLNVQDARCLVVGGGATAARKAEMLLEAGARVEAVSPEFKELFHAMKARFGDALTLRTEAYVSGDLSAYRLVFAATNDTATNRAVADDGQRANLWVNVVDEPALCTAICGAVLQRGPLQAVFSTGGTCPTLAVALRDEFSAACPESTGPFGVALGGLRRWLAERCPDASVRRAVLCRLSAAETRARLAELTGAELTGALRDEAERMLAGRQDQMPLPPM